MAAKKKTKKKTTAKKAAPKKKKKTKTPAAKQAKSTSKPKAKAKSKPKAKAKPKGVLPTAQEEARFWSLIEDAWATQDKEANRARKALAKRKPSEDDDDGDDPEGLDVVYEALDGLIESLTEALSFEEFPKEELLAMDRVLERKLYDIDRQEIQEVTDGSDDGFLYARGFIVALGKDFYDAVNKNPKVAIMDAECEEMCYLPAHIYSERFGGEFPETGSNISRESCENTKGWPELDSPTTRGNNL